MSRRFAKAGRFADSPGEIEGAEITFIRQKGRAGFSHQAIAGMIGVPVSDVARFAEMDLGAVAKPPVRRLQPAPMVAPVAPDCHLFVQRLGVDISPNPSGSMKEIAEWVALRHGLSVAEIRGPLQGRSFAWPRQEAFALTLATGRYSYPQVGRFYNRDHTTVMHGVRAHEARLKGEKLDRSRGLKARAE